MKGYANKRYELMTLSGKRLLERISDEYKSWVLPEMENKKRSAAEDGADAAEGYPAGEPKTDAAEPNLYFCFNLKYQLEKKLLIKETNIHADNAMFYQIRDCLGYRTPLPKKEESQRLKKTIVYVDFSDVFMLEGSLKKTSSGRLRMLFLNGFSLVHEDGTKVAYMPFDSSASMSRKSCMTFIDNSLLTAKSPALNLDHRLRLGIDFLKIKLVPSKYFAYTGLYLTDAKRIDEMPYPDETTGEPLYPPLNEETVIVLPETIQPDSDENSVCNNGFLMHTLRDQSVITYDAEVFSVPETRGEVRKVEEIRDLMVTAYDGEGLVSPLYAEWINKRLFDDREERKATSFQVRMPFTKGMLHQVDYHGFMKEMAGRTDLMIEDRFGIERDLSKAQIILTASMFKCDKWLEEYCGTIGIEDPMKYYFEQFHAYEHALYVGNTNLNNPLRGTVKMNYQFFNTLDMDRKTMQKLVQKQKEFCDRIVDDPSGTGREWLLRIPENDETDSDGNVVTEEDEIYARYESDAWRYALAKNPEFAYDPRVKNELKRSRYSLIKNIAEGRIEVDGALQYLSDDLLNLLYYIIYISKLEEPFKSRLLKNLRKCTLHTSKFYTADAEALKLNALQHYAILRSPHLSRSEQCAQRPYLPYEDADCSHRICCADDGTALTLYEKYFSHLKGVLMVAFSSDAATVLGGADYDGDYVKLITEPLITNAVLKGVYEWVQPEEDHSFVCIRKLPIAWIRPADAQNIIRLGEWPQKENLNETSGQNAEPEITGGGNPNLSDTKADEGYLTSAYYQNMLEYVTEAFNSRVGIISNNALEVGRCEYSDLSNIDAEKAKYLRECYSGMSALSTVMTGMEIDAVKTGVRPQDISYAELPEGIQSAGRDYLKRKDKLKTMEADDFGKLQFYTDAGYIAAGSNKKVSVPVKEEIDDRPEDAFGDMGEEIFSGAVESSKGGARSAAAKKRTKKEFKPFMEVTADEYEGRICTNIDYLPYLCLNALNEHKEYAKTGGKQKKTAGKRVLFLFDHPSFMEADYEDRESRMRILIKTYSVFNSQTGWLYTLSKMKKEDYSIDFLGYVRQILNTRYDLTVDTLPNTGTDLVWAQITAYDELSGSFENKKQVADAVKRYIQYLNDYTLAPREEWESALLKILDQNDLKFGTDQGEWSVTKELLMEPTKDGYKVLYYLLRCLEDEHSQFVSIIDIEDTISKVRDRYEGFDEQLLREMLAVYKNAQLMKKTKSVWFPEIQALCEDRMKQIFDGDLGEAFRCAHQLRTAKREANKSKLDESGSFFWNMFDIDLYKKYLYVPEENKAAGSK